MRISSLCLEGEGPVQLALDLRVLCPVMRTNLRTRWVELPCSKVGIFPLMSSLFVHLSRNRLLGLTSGCDKRLKVVATK